MKKERIIKNKRIFIVGGIIIALILILTGCGNKDENSAVNNNVNENQVQNTEKQADNVANNTKVDNTVKNNTKTDTSTSENNKATSGNELVVNREGMSDKVESKLYTSSLGYTMRYATENFSATYHDNKDWFECGDGIDCVVVEKENVSYSKKIASLSNYKNTKVNGYEAVYTTRKVEGQAETTYYVNTGKDSTYMITTSCQDNPEYLEGLGHIMSAMVQTFALR